MEFIAMESKCAKYRIYPSLLDAFSKFLNSDVEFEEFYNQNGEGDYIHTSDEITQENEKRLLDMINRVPQPLSVAMERGTCLNAAVDFMISKVKKDPKFWECYANFETYDYKEDVKMRNKVLKMEVARFDADNLYFKIDDCDDVGNVLITCKFDLDFVIALALSYEEAICQHFVNDTIDTPRGMVELYGYIDYFKRDKVIDLKTTKSYKFGKYEYNWQRHAYPYCLAKKGYKISAFDFDVVEWKGGTINAPLLWGNKYRESYNFNFDESRFLLSNICDSFICWLEKNREKITDERIFVN